MIKSEKEQIKILESRLSQLKVKSMTQLVEGSSIIRDFMLLRWSLEGIEEAKKIDSEFKDDIMSTHTDMRDKILKWKTAEDVYRDACQEYFDICALLFY